MGGYFQAAAAPGQWRSGAVPVDVTQWAKEVINVGLGPVMGLAVIWYLWYLTTKTLPDRDARFLAELKEERNARQSQHLDNRADHTAMIQLVSQATDRLLAKIEQSEAKLIEQIADTRHALVNLDGAVTTVLEIQNREQQRKRRLREQGQQGQGEGQK